MTPIAFEAQDLGHRFGNRWVFQGVSGSFNAGEHGVIRGANGSGKSTLGRILTGALQATSGTLTWSAGPEAWDWQRRDELVLRTLLMAPAASLHPDLTVREACAFHGRFRSWWADFDPLQSLDAAGIAHAFDKPLRTLSSGMRQRVQLAIALGTESGLICLDEPCANLDQRGIDWYRELLQTTRPRTTTLICSNDRKEDHLEPDWVLELR